NALVGRLKKDVMEEGGKKLGILKGNALILDSEDELSVLMDYCIYDVRRKGRNAVEDYLADSPPPADSDEMLILQAMRKAWYSLFQVQEVMPGVGVQTLDVLRQAPQFIVDLGFSRTADRGAVLATRVIPFADFTMTGGAALPVQDEQVLDRVVEGV